METGFDPLLGSFYYRCIWGCFATDFESTAEARHALDVHDCMNLRFPEES